MLFSLFKKKLFNYVTLNYSWLGYQTDVVWFEWGVASLLNIEVWSLTLVYTILSVESLSVF